TPEQALIRELQEEVGITPTQVTLFDTLEYQFPDRHITLWFWLPFEVANAGRPGPVLVDIPKDIQLASGELEPWFTTVDNEATFP
ncbi:NUDIX domain-containing protein, partial [Salmonella enterica subsp. enterica serovar Montevideo]|nr:NUDIX domain-containing protein [Salmonella enterica subsp. enterica serovar Montevideo]